jgi:TM2 domain-containing membrane protein YozV
MRRTWEAGMANGYEARKAAREQFSYSRPAKSKLAIFLIWLFFGYFGGHRFYAGRLASGLGQLALLITGVVVALLGAWTLGNLMIGAVMLWAWIDLLFMWSWISRHNDGRYAFG